MRRLFFISIISFWASILFGQQNFFQQNYNLAKNLYDNGIIEKVIAKPEKITDDLKQAFLLAEYYKCSNENVDIEEMRNVLNIYFHDPSWNNKDLSEVESQYFKLINEIDKELHKKDFSYLNDLIFFH